MNPCEFYDLLVDYCDGDLDSADRQRVADHLSDCEACGTQLDLLQRSLAVARQVWRTSPTDAVIERAAATSMIARGKLPALLLSGGCAALLLLGLFWLPARRNTNEIAASKPKVATEIANDHEQPDHEQPDVDVFVSRQTRAAKLAATQEILARDPNLIAFANRSRSYIQKAYSTDP